jgi:GDPmannose 4,6-dehydratase
VAHHAARRAGRLCVGNRRNAFGARIHRACFPHVGRTIKWVGSGTEERGLDTHNGDVLVQIDPRYFRPTEVDLLLGDPSKARQQLGWSHKIGFEVLVREMVESDVASLKAGDKPSRSPD